ncbi:hypothetical protein BOSEA31B_11559 [Hyphomicrobiales bacterium]|nr:hypothetical protein BOSEA31B_11559 [Hyphomicrobiales bacterium]CAH1697354.1 hypothetical protein BOSEA1005_10391 [Hyphomicrobiales bacterium]CAI0345541.1 hypothetical protein BO1005MUT1_30056 [Hyphomicrobiales bacterium]
MFLSRLRRLTAGENGARESDPTNQAKRLHRHRPLWIEARGRAENPARILNGKTRPQIRASS